MIRIASYIGERFSVIVSNSVTLLTITEQTSVISGIRGEFDRDQRNYGTVFRYFAIDSDIRVNNIRPFRYLGIRGAQAPAKAASLHRSCDTESTFIITRPLPDGSGAVSNSRCPPYAPSPFSESLAHTASPAADRSVRDTWLRSARTAPPSNTASPSPRACIASSVTCSMEFGTPAP